MEPLRIPVGGDLVLDAISAGPLDAPAVVLLHGFPQTSWCWRGVWPALLEAGYRIVAPDQRGYSPDARPDGIEPYAMPHLVGDVVGVLDAIGADRAHVVGHDWGAAITWQLAARHPERVRTITAVSVPHPVAFADALRTDPDQRQRSQYMRDWLDPGTETALLDGGLEQVFGGIPTVDAAHYLAVLREPGVLTRALSYYRAVSRQDVEGLGPITAPTLHVWSDADPALGAVATHASAAHVDGDYRLVVLEGVSHWIPEQAPDTLAGLLLEHLGDHP